VTTKLATEERLHISEIRLDGFKRFTNTIITGIPLHARLVVLAGPNGSGKSSLFDGLQTWHYLHGGNSRIGWDESYGAKVGSPPRGWTDHVQVAFHEVEPTDAIERQKILYIRSAFRNEADFEVSTFKRLPSPLGNNRVARLIDPDASVSENYQRMVMQTLDSIYDSSIPDTASKADIRDRIIGDVQRAMSTVFPDLVLSGVGGIGPGSAQQGSFYFDKGSASGFLYKNLSAGEKAAFDLILDMVIKRDFFDNTIWCIDEPETHLNTRIQASLLEVMLDLMPDNCQLWLASHSIGFMRAAWQLAQKSRGEVAFLDMEGVDFDSPVSINPVQPTRQFWSRTLDVALGDLAALVAPERIVLCEGRPSRGAGDEKAEFDATCFRTIFGAEHPETDFMSVGNSLDASEDRLGVGRAIQAVASGTAITRLRDRDLLSDEEVDELKLAGVRVLSRRHIEAYLLDDEMLCKLCVSLGSGSAVTDVLAIKKDALAASVARGNDGDDLKSVAGEIYTKVRKRLSIMGAGSNWNAFAKTKLAPLVTPETATYQSLLVDIFE
jgi:energy-coupling factor transporter ATP-binding protein EcfA2